jgi:hypothetical protein
MDEPPSRYGVTFRVANDDGHQPNPAAFAAAASQAASNRHASVVSAHTAQEIMLIADPPVTYAEISARLGIPIGPTRSRYLNRIRRHPAVSALINAESGSLRPVRAAAS